MSKVGFEGPLVERDRAGARAYSVWVSPSMCDIEIGGTAETYTDTRTADGVYHRLRSAAGGAETDYIIVPLNHAPFMVTDAADISRGEVARGLNPTNVQFIFAPGVVDATSITAELHETTFVQGAAATVDSNSVTITTAASLTQHATNISFASYTFALDAAPTVTAANLQMAIVLANTGTFRFYGAIVNGSILL